MKLYTRNPSELSRSELIEVVTDIRQVLYPRTDLTVDWDSDTVDGVSNVLFEHKLTPTEEAYRKHGERE